MKGYCLLTSVNKLMVLSGLMILFFMFAAVPASWAEDQEAGKPAVQLSSNPKETSKPLEAAVVETSQEMFVGTDNVKEDKDYVMQTGDRIKITIYPEDDHIKGAEMEISSEGNITLPLVGKVSVAGKKPIEAEKEIAIILDRDYLVNPEVVIEVTDKYASEKEKSVVLLGQVKQPGSQPFPKAGRFTLLQAIAVAGGFSDVANIKKIKVIRGGEVKGEVLRANAEDIISGKKPDIDLEDGDIINVAESLF